MTLGIDGRAPSMASPAGLLSTSSFAMAHLKYRSHPLPHTPGGLGVRRPYGCKDRQQVAAAYGVDMLVADLGEGMSFEGLNPR